MYSITFLNQNSDNTVEKSGLAHLESRKSDLEWFMNNGNNEENENEDLPPFYEYGLCFDYVEAEDGQEDYFRYQFSWGGPSEEIRFYENGETVFVYLDWFCGVGFDVTGEDWAEWLRDWFSDCCMMDYSSEREKYDYYDMIEDCEE